MKTSLMLLIMCVSLAFTSACSKDEVDGISIQEHDQNMMMNIMHEMMNEMNMMEMTMDPDHDFASMMMMHHQGAIEMANAELESGNDATMKAMAQKIITDQQAEIAQLEAFVESHTPHQMSMEAHDKMMMGMDKMSKNADLQIINGDVDHDFATLMIEHHQSAVEMAQLELQYGHDEAMREMAQNIIDGQEQEIMEFQDWLLDERSK